MSRFSTHLFDISFFLLFFAKTHDFFMKEPISRIFFSIFTGRVPAHLPREFDWPIPKRLKLWICEKILKRKNATNADTSDEGGIESGIRTFPGQWLFSMNFSKMCSSTTTS